MYCSDGVAADVFDTIIQAELSGMDRCLQQHGYDHTPERPITCMCCSMATHKIKPSSHLNMCV
jgi:hypothetical protein